MSVQYHAPAALPPGKNTSTDLIGCWVGHRACMKVSPKRKISLPYPASTPGPSSSLPSRYIDCTTPAPLQPIRSSVEIYRNGRCVFSADAHSFSQKIVNCQLTNMPHGLVNTNSTVAGYCHTVFWNSIHSEIRQASGWYATASSALWYTYNRTKAWISANWKLWAHQPMVSSHRQKVVCIVILKSITAKLTFTHTHTHKVFHDF